MNNTNLCDLMFGHLGNGITVCDRSRMVGGDYKTVAHIDPCGVYKLHCPIPPEAVQQIKRMAQSEGERFAAQWESLTPSRRHYELAEYALRWAQYKEIGADAIQRMNAQESLKLYQKYTCINSGYTMP